MNTCTKNIFNEYKIIHITGYEAYLSWNIWNNDLCACLICFGRCSNCNILNNSQALSDEVSLC